MQRYMRSHLSDHALIQSAVTHAGSERAATADLIADIAEIDERRLYLPAGYPSLLAYCVGALKLCEQAAFKRMQAARAARRFPSILHALAEGRLHLTAVVLLAPHLTEHTADELLAAATHKSKSEIERLLAARFPKSDMLAWVAAVPAACSGPESAGSEACQLSPGIVQNGTVGGAAAGCSSPKPLSAQSFAVQFTLSRADHDKLRYAQELLSHQIPSGDIAQVFVRALDALIPQLEKARFAATDRPRSCHRRPAADSRHIPDAVQRAVWERDGGRCTFVSESGHRCEARKFVEFDHIDPFARGGEATVDSIRLLCRAHNQYEAERTFGAEFMRHRRIAAAEARAAAKAEAKAETKRQAQAARETAAAVQAVRDAHVLEVVPYLRPLGYHAREARDAAELCRDMPEATIEQRVRVALSYFRLRGTKLVPAGGGEPELAAAS